MQKVYVRSLDIYVIFLQHLMFNCQRQTTVHLEGVDLLVLPKLAATNSAEKTVKMVVILIARAMNVMLVSLASFVTAKNVSTSFYYYS